MISMALYIYLNSAADKAFAAGHSASTDCNY